ncbi:MAG: YccF domain-containing protein, partial [Oscillospiraceae bacterium]|nr:YccF domain-containing protein [Oscillospiraceae bacterium]
MKTIGNILWVIFGGAILALLWAIVGILCFISIIGI